MNDKEWDDMSEEEQVSAEKRENKQLKRHSRRLRSALLDKLSKDKESEEFPNLDGSNKQVYAIATILDGLDRDVQESEKALATKEGANDTGALVTAVFESIVERIGDPSSKFASGERAIRTVGDNTRLRPENTASQEHMFTGKDDIDYDSVFNNDEPTK